jgi:Cd2+/Zn2+-exporting ATPase
MSTVALLSRAERRLLGTQLTLAMLAGGLLLLAVGLRLLAPDQADVTELVAGVAAALVAVPALAAAWHSLRHPDLHGITDLLIALALVAAWAAGDLVTAALLPLVMTIGHVLEERSLLGSREAIAALGRLTQGHTRRLLDTGEEEEVPTSVLRVGERVRLRAGDLVPADGVVESGVASLDTASLTGESVPDEVGLGASVFAGAVNLDGVLTVRIERTGAATTLGRVIALMRAAERAKPPVSRLLERYAGRYLVLVLLAAAGLWLATGNTPAMLAVLVASCPCALVLAAPATAVAAIAVAARHGILVKGSAFLEHLALVDSVVLDKTGTVTLGELRLAAVRPEPGIQRDALLAAAASLGAASRHPVSRALARSGTPTAIAEAVREIPGLGVTAQLDGADAALGRPELFAELAVAVSPPPAHDGPVAGVSRGGRFLGWLLLADEPRPEARQALAELRAMGLDRQLLLTGDRAAVAAMIGRLLGIADVRAEALPEQKLEAVLAQTRAGYRPLVVGDGINDSLALRAGAVGVAMGAGGTDVALASADLVLMTSDLRRLATAIRLSRRCRRTIHLNVGLGLGWTLAIVALAATGLLGAEGALVAAVLHNAGTLAVMANAGRLLRFDELSAVAGSGAGLSLPAATGEELPDPIGGLAHG